MATATATPATATGGGQQSSAFGRYVLQELQKVSSSIQTLTTAAPQTLAAAPQSPLIGTIRYATGDWGTSLGKEGLYVNQSTGWERLATAVDITPLVAATATKATAQGVNNSGYTVSSTTATALGMGLHLIPAVTGRVLVIATGIFNTPATTVEVQYSLRYGSGSSPAQGANISSATVIGASLTPSDNTAGFGYMGWALNGVVLNLTVGQEYWFDVEFHVNTSSVTLYQTSLSVVEI